MYSVQPAATEKGWGGNGVVFVPAEDAVVAGAHARLAPVDVLVNILLEIEAAGEIGGTSGLDLEDRRGVPAGDEPAPDGVIGFRPAAAFAKGELPDIGDDEAVRSQWADSMAWSLRAAPQR